MSEQELFDYCNRLEAALGARDEIFKEQEKRIARLEKILQELGLIMIAEDGGMLWIRQAEGWVALRSLNP